MDSGSFRNGDLPRLLSSSTRKNEEFEGSQVVGGLDHPLSGPCSACDVHSCTGQMGKRSQKERKPWTKQCRDSFNPASSPPCLGHQVGRRDQKWAHGSWLSSKGLRCPEMVHTRARTTSSLLRAVPQPLSCPGCTGATLGSHHSLFLYLKAVCNETSVFSTPLWWDPAWKHTVVWVPVPLAHIQSLPHQKVQEGLFWAGAMRQTGFVHHHTHFHFSSCVEYKETKQQLGSSGTLNSVELNVLLALLVCYRKTKLWFLVWKWR